MRAVILVGHGSLRKASGAAMIRHAQLLRQRGLAEIGAAAFLNFSRPTFLETLERCVHKGATEIVVQPYFLIDGYYVRRGIPELIAEGRDAYPGLTFHLADAFGYHPGLVELVLQRVVEALPEPTDGPHVLLPHALLLMAHGTPLPEANGAIEAVAREIEARGEVAGSAITAVMVAYMELNAPSIAEAVAALAARGARQITAVPYFLQLGGHVVEDLPEEVAGARARHPSVALRLAEHLAYDARLVDVIADRVAAAARL